jgi:glucosamine-6-phosphate deaminase
MKPMNNPVICENAADAGNQAAAYFAGLIHDAINIKGTARMLVSTGQSQFEFFNALCAQKIDWQKVTLFHLDEYIGLDENHPASFVRYLKERFTNRINIAQTCFINGMNNPADEILSLNAAISEAPIDVAAIGIGENGHIAFNDPPADFETHAPFHIVTLDERCKQQQVNEGWFPSLDDVPKTAVSITPRQIMAAKKIVSVVPFRVKAQAVADTIHATGPDPMVPASLLKQHADWRLYLDKESAALI